MFINEDIVAHSFRIINFFTLIGLSFFLFKKYVKTDLLSLIAEKQAAQESLFEQQTSLEKQQSHLDALLKEELILCQELKLKIDAWKKMVTLENDIHEKEFDSAMIMMKERAASLALSRENERVQTIVLHAVAANLEKSLSAHFKDQKKSTDYLSGILHFMNERVS